MTLSIANEPTESIPLRVSDEDIIYVDDTRVTLDTVVEAFQDGATPEEIVYQYPSLQLADVYAVVSYYLRHRSLVEEYLAQRRQERERVRKQNESRFPPQGIRERLLARRQQQTG
jgi:uncharacterized protein (DUF433 family)